MLTCAARRGGPIWGLLGAGLLARSLTNLPAKRLVGVGAGHRAVDVRKTISIARPIDDVFTFFSDWRNFPLFMSNVREVRARPSGRSHWVRSVEAQRSRTPA